MRKRVLFALLLSLCLGLSVAVVQTGYAKYEQITVDTVIGFTAANIVDGGGHPQAVKVSCRLETADVRWTVDGTTPTTTIGVVLTAAGDPLVLEGNDILRRFQAIKATVTPGVLNCHYFGAP